MKSARARLWVAFFGVAWAVSNLQAAISIFGFSSSANDRFANSPSFVAYEYNLSGVGLDNYGKWLAMISPNVYLSAYHYHSVVGASVTFYASNDPNGLSATRTVTGTAQRIGSSDLWIGTINEPLPSSFVYYDFATEDIANWEEFVLSPYYNAEAFLLGRSPTAWPTSLDVAVGRNKLDVWFDSANDGGTIDDAIGAVYDVYNGQPGGNFIEYEALLQPGDSGAAMFVPSGAGKLTLVGINWFIAPPPPEDPRYNGFSYVGNYDGQIRSFLNAYSVPEPSGVVGVTGLLVLAWSIWRRVRKCSE